MSPNPPTSHPLMKMGFRQRWQAKFILSPYPIQAAGFTLIELSIVLVIIGLIVGGVLVGQDLIRAAQMRSVANDWGKFEIAKNTFRLKYNCLPGDCPNAATFGMGDNGDGNHYISNPNVEDGEPWQYWKHLAEAGLISGIYTGTYGADSEWHTVIGENIPTSKISGVGYGLDSATSFYPAALGALSIPSHIYVTGRYDEDGAYNYGGAFTAQESYVLDDKIDDGIANSGRVRVVGDGSNWTAPTCITGTPPNYDYDLSDDECLTAILYVTQP